MLNEITEIVPESPNQACSALAVGVSNLNTILNYQNIPLVVFYRLKNADKYTPTSSFDCINLGAWWPHPRPRWPTVVLPECTVVASEFTVAHPRPRWPHPRPRWHHPRPRWPTVAPPASKVVSPR